MRVKIAWCISVQFLVSLLQAFADLCLTQADVMQAVGDAIMTFDEIQTLTPRYIVHVYVAARFYAPT